MLILKKLIQHNRLFRLKQTCRYLNSSQYIPELKRIVGTDQVQTDDIEQYNTDWLASYKGTLLVSFVS